MPLIKFIGYNGILLLAESIATALIGVTIITIIIPLIFRSRNDLKIAACHWSTLGTKCFTLWATDTMIVIGAAHYANGNRWYYWTSIILGTMLLISYKIASMQNAKQDCLKNTARQSGPLFAQAALANSPMPKLWTHETRINIAAIFYILIIALYEPLTKIQWLQFASREIELLFTVNVLLSIALCFVAWLLTAGYLFRIILFLLALMSLAKENRDISDHV